MYTGEHSVAHVGEIEANIGIVCGDGCSEHVEDKSTIVSTSPTLAIEETTKRTTTAGEQRQSTTTPTRTTTRTRLFQQFIIINSNIGNFSYIFDICPIFHATMSTDLVDILAYHTCFPH